MVFISHTAPECGQDAFAEGCRREVSSAGVLMELGGPCRLEALLAEVELGSLEAHTLLLLPNHHDLWSLSSPPSPSSQMASETWVVELGRVPPLVHCVPVKSTHSL